MKGCVGPLQFKREAVEAESVTPPTQQLQKNTAPLRRANILDGWPAGGDHGFKVINQSLRLGLKPRSMSVDTKCVVQPLFARPPGGAIRKGNLVFHLSIHLVRLRRRGVMLHDNFRGGGGLFLLSNKN